ncbi:hypothetical protein H0H87_005674 [Tephrocybe sp. NHM501043]|nr:hypothetical protein H0H87_005674 [Tephrocybe sp. NHM501043]
MSSRGTPRTTSNNIPPRAITAATHAYNPSQTIAAPAAKASVPPPNVISLEAVGKFQKSLEALQSGFSFPKHLDFLDHSDNSDGSPFGSLSFTTNNRALREHKEALIRIQTDLDAVPSHGNELVRISRKKVIDKVEQALRELEDEVKRRLDEWRRSTKLRREVPVLEKPSLKDLPPETPPIPYIPTLPAKPPTLDPPQPPGSKRPSSIPEVKSTAFPLPPIPTPDVCRIVGLDARFHNEYKNMSDKFTRIQIQRFQAIANHQPTTEFDKALVALDKNWKSLVHTLVLVVRNEEVIGGNPLDDFLAFKRNGPDSWSSGSESDSDGVQTNYLRLALDPYDNNDKAQSRHGRSAAFHTRGKY